MPVKERKLELRLFVPDVYFVSGGVSTPNGDTLFATGSQITDSTSHRYNPDKRCYDEGGPFFTSRVDYGLGTVDAVGCINYSGSDKKYTGPVWCPLPTPAEFTALGFENTYGSLNESSMDVDGATAISRCAPDNPNSNLGQAIGESMRDGLPSLHGSSLWESKALAIRNAGDEYLNHVFGWTPLVNDVRDTSKVAAESGELAERLHSKQGSNTHRSYEFPSDTQTNSSPPVSTGAAVVPGSPTAGWRDPAAGSATRTLTRVKSTRKWFEGSFTYAMPPKDDFWRRHVESGRKARELYGLQLNPELLWELAPWSWAVDWFSNAGSVISNVTRFVPDGLVMRYGYVMEETIDTITATQDRALLRSDPVAGADNFTQNHNLGPLSAFVRVTTKRRRPANPFGFGIGWEDLSPFQLSVAAALGISRLL